MLALPGEIVRAAEAKLAAIAEQLGELARLQCRLRRLVQVCAHGSSDDCLALQFDHGHDQLPTSA